MGSTLNKSSLTDHVFEVIDSFGLLKKGATVVVGVSGGPDSVALLHILCQLRYRLGIKIIVGHFNHQLRSEASTDEAFVIDLACRLNIPVTSAKPKRKCPKQGSVEDWARQERFKFLVKLAAKHHARAIALAHTQDDLAETVLMRVIRGSGLLGLRGILLERKIGGVSVVRPLLYTRKKDILVYLRSQRLSYRIDKSNLKTDFFRNKIRLDLLPFLEKRYNSNITHVLANLADSVSTDYDFIKSQSDILFFRVAKAGRSVVRLSVKGLVNVHPALLRMVFRRSFEDLKGDLKQLTLIHIFEIEDLLRNRPSGSIVHLPGGVSVKKSKMFLEWVND